MKTQSNDLRAQERSQTTQVAFLYHFNYEGTHYYYTGFDQDIVVTGGPGSKMADPQAFITAQISHTNPQQTLETTPQAVNVVLSALDPELKKYLVKVAPKVITVEIFRVNSAMLPGDIMYANDLQMVFRGLIESLSFSDNTIQATCITLIMQEDRVIPRFNYQKQCNHVLYSQVPGTCLVNPELYRLDSTIAVVNKQSQYFEIAQTAINVDAPSRSLTIAPGTFEGGYIVTLAGEKAGILATEVIPAGAGTRLWCNWMPQGVAVGQSITLYCGCLRTKKHCHEQFNNLPNHGGLAYIPKNNLALDGI